MMNKILKGPGESSPPDPEECPEDCPWAAEDLDPKKCPKEYCYYDEPKNWE